LKKIGLLFLFLFIATKAQSQVLLSLLFGDKLNSESLEFGLEGGFNFSNISDVGTRESLRNYNLGFYFDLTLKDRLHLDTGVLVKSTMGANNLNDEDLDFLGAPTKEEPGTYRQKISYFIVPVLLKYSLKNRIYLEAGPEIALMRKAHVEFNFENETESIRKKYFNTNKINRIDAGITVGTGYKLRKNDGITLGVKYYFGLVDVYKDKPGSKNNSFFLRLKVPIGADAAKNKREKKTNKTNE
jgi:hypothetical protein